jgi:IPT/TIG domain
MNSTRVYPRSLLLALAALAVLAPALVPTFAQAAPAPRITSIDSSAAVSGAAITLRGSGFATKGVTVSVSGKRAKVLKKTARTLRFSVPKVRVGAHTVVVRSGAKKAQIAFRVLTPFRGKVAAKLEAKNGKKATIGAAGGNIAVTAADGTRFTLVIPAGALSKDEAIQMTPVASFTGFPLTGARISGVRLTPDGLTLSRTATLIVQGGGPFAATTFGFGYGSTTGLELAAANKVGATRTVLLDHFSDHGAAAARAADFANLVQPLINKRGPLTRAQVRSVVGLVEVWDDRFPNFCRTQPVCRQLLDKAMESINTLVTEACARATGPLTFDSRASRILAIRPLTDLGADANLLTGTRPDALVCIDKIARDLADDVLAAIARNPLEHYTFAFLGSGGDPDINRDRRMSAWEFGRALIPEIQLLAVIGRDVQLGAATGGAFPTIRENAIKRCATDRPGGTRDMQEGFDYLQFLRGIGVEPSGEIDQFVTAFAKCGVDVVVVPSILDIAPGQKAQFEAQLSSPAAAAAGASWSANRGFISLTGLYTAPQATGLDEVRATSELNEDRFSTARVNVLEPEACVGPGAASLGGPSAANVQARVVQPGNVVLKTPEDIAAFKAAGITEVTGDVTIGGDFANPTTLVDLTGLEGLTTIGGSLTIRFNPALTNVQGLSGLRTLAGGLFVQSNGTTNLRGLEGLASVQFLSVSQNAALASLDGLCGLTSVTGFIGVNVTLNPSLTSLTGLSGLTTAGALAVTNNDILPNVDGLEALTIVAGNVRVGGAQLASVAGLRNLTTIGQRLDVDTGASGGTFNTFALPGLQQAGVVDISGSGGSITTVSLPALTEIVGTGIVSQFSMFSSSGVTSVQAPALASVNGDFIAENINRALTVTLGTNTHIKRDLRLSGNNTPAGSIAISVGTVDRDVSVDQFGGGDVNVGSVVRDVSFRNNKCAPLSTLQLATPGVRVATITNNTGFSDATATSYGNSLGPGQAPIVSGNVAAC